MNIAEELQTEASERAGSPEGFLKVIRLVIDNVENREEVQQLSPLPFIDMKRFPEFSWPEQYLPVLREYVSLMQEVLQCKKQWDALIAHYQKQVILYIPDDYKAAQKKLSDHVHAAKRKKRELPIHAYKRLVAIETRNASCWGITGKTWPR